MLHVVAVAVPVTPLLLGTTGAVWIVRGVIGLASPTYYAPVSTLDFTAVWTLSGALLLTAASFAALLRTWPEGDPAAGVAALAGMAAAAAGRPATPWRTPSASTPAGCSLSLIHI